jgi:hypothetical protein
MAPIFAFPQPVLDAHRQGKLAILCGSGLSLDVPGDFPRWNQLPERLLDSVERQGIWNAAQIEAKRAFLQKGRVSLDVMLAELDSLRTALGSQPYRAALTALFRPKSGAPGDVHRAVVETGVKVLLTTNFDLLLEAVEGIPSRVPYTWQKADKALDDINGGGKVLFKIHGTAQDDDSVVMTRTEYDRAVSSLSYRQTMINLLQNYTFLLVGYGINDPRDLDLVFGLSKNAFGSAARVHYALMRNASGDDSDRWWRELNVQVVPYEEHVELPTLLRVLGATPPDPR